MNISVAPIKHFLDAVDKVLNSNTFILEFEICTDDIEKELETFLFSDNFTNQILEQDKERGWYNFHYFDNKTAENKKKSGTLTERNFRLQIIQPSYDKKEYLMSMLTCDASIANYFSFYNNQIKTEKARIIIDELTDYLTLYNEEWDLYIVQPSFLKSMDKSYGNKEELIYFGGAHGNDSATIIRYYNKAYLILTNGID